MDIRIWRQCHPADCPSSSFTSDSRRSTIAGFNWGNSCGFETRAPGNNLYFFHSWHDNVSVKRGAILVRECDGVGELFRVQEEGEQTGYDFLRLHCTLKICVLWRESFVAYEIRTCLFATRIFFPSYNSSTNNNIIITLLVFITKIYKPLLCSFLPSKIFSFDPIQHHLQSPLNHHVNKPRSQ